MQIAWPPTFLQKVLAAVVGFVLLCGAGCYVIRQREQAAADLAKAEEQERASKEKDHQVSALLEETKKLQEEAKAEREKNDADRALWAEQQAALTRAVIARNQSADKAIAAALAPKPIQQVADEAKTILGPTAPVVQDGSFRLTAEQMQQFLAMKIDRDRLAENLKETLGQLDIERKTTATLRADLDRAIKAIEDANKRTEEQRLLKEDWKQVAESYKKAAKKSGWRKAFEFGGRAGMTVALAYLGARAAR